MVTVFEQGDIIYMDFDPQAGHEQRGRRPALVVSNNVYNRFSSLTLVCPITHTDRHHPLQVKLEGTKKTDGFIMCDQVRALDAKSRDASFEEKVPDAILAEVVDIVMGIIEIK